MFAEDVNGAAVAENVFVDFEADFEGEEGEEGGLGLDVCYLVRVGFEEASQGKC